MNATSATFERILLPTDFSGFSFQALRHALALTRKFKARLRVVHVVQDLYSRGDAKPAFPGPDAADARRMAERETHAFMTAAREAGIDYETQIREGNPWREIQAAAEEMPADLVIMGTHGRSGAERFLLGSVAEKLVHRLPCPVMTVRHDDGAAWEGQGLIRRILCATDFSENSERAFHLSLALASSLGAKVTLLHAIEHMPDLGEARYRMVVPDVKPLLSEIERTASERLERAAALPARWAGVDVTARLGAGRACDEIVRVALDEGAGLIVIGAQRHGLLEHVLSGSNAQQVIRSANCAVLTVRPEKLESAVSKSPVRLAG
ncbi:MAG: universal stress protein [Vicinamibacteria bacterium]|nr:universal stress protein [Vicinamibacteria bacterium]